MIPLSLSKIATIIGGTLNEHADPDALVTGTVEFDSRQISPGALFLCIPGARVDGHQYAEQAVNDGAIGVIATKPVNVPAIMVEPLTGVESNASALENDVDGSVSAILEAVAKLARHVVKTLVAKHQLIVVGITGSSGKTSTKDLVTAVLASQGNVVAPPGSFNNELGFPWTALRSTKDTDFLVLEMSARGIGHIRQLCQIVAPNIGVELNVGTAHLGEFGSQEAIAEAKGELVEALPGGCYGGVALLNDDDPLVATMDTRTSARVLRFGARPHADYQCTNIRLDDYSRPSYTLQTGGRKYEVSLAVAGRHNVYNSLAALAVGQACGVPLKQGIEALRNATIVSGRRMEIMQLDTGLTIINDSYNANPDSMKAAIKTLSTIAHPNDKPTRKSWAVLGLMAELGEESIHAHQALAQVLEQEHIDRIITVGVEKEMQSLYKAAKALGIQARNVHTKEEAIALLEQSLADDDVVLVKASQSVGMWDIAEALRDYYDSSE